MPHPSVCRSDEGLTWMLVDVEEPAFTDRLEDPADTFTVPNV